MNPSLDQVESSLFAMQKHFEKQAKSLERYAANPEAKQSYINERNQELAILANSINMIEDYISCTFMLYPYCLSLKAATLKDPELRLAIIKLPLRLGDPKDKIVLIEQTE